MYVKYIQKYREKNYRNIEQADKFVVKNIHWLLDKKCDDIALGCLQKHKNLPPIYSNRIIENIKRKASPGFVRKYLEYLTLGYSINETLYHTELALSYINEITNLVDNRFIFENEIDTEAIENDPTIFELRRKLKKFLETSKLYHLNTIFMSLPHQYMLQEIAFILACDKKYNEAFEIGVSLKDIEYSRYIADQVFLKNNDSEIFFKLFEVLVDNKLSDAAIDLLDAKVQYMPYNKIFMVFKKNEVLTEKHYKIFIEVFNRVEKFYNLCMKHEKVSMYEVIKNKSQFHEALSENFLLTNKMIGEYCGKGIKSPNVYYDSKARKVYHVFCKNNVPNIKED